jgi:tricorn protease
MRAEIGGARAAKSFDLAAAKERTLVEGAMGFALSPDGRVLVAREGAGLATVRLDGADAAPARAPLPRMEVEVDRRAEWREIFADAWRRYRDFFYDVRMHGVDWAAVRDRYAPLVEACATREDLNFVLAEMAGELNVGHAFVGRPGDVEQPPSGAATGMLGADFEVDAGGVRVARVYEGAPWDPDSRGPLARPGVDARAGDYLLAVDGRTVDARGDPRASLAGLADRDVAVTLGVAGGAGAREVRVRPVSSENAVRYAAWVEANRAYVARKTGGRVGYIHLPDFGNGGLNALVRQLYGQADKEAIVVDARWSQGGSLGDVFARMLDSRTLNYLGGRGEAVQAIPTSAHHGPKCLVVSGMTVSAGENFASYFRKSGLGRIVGTRTWGGLVGTNGTPALVDGGTVSVPDAPFFEEDGTWMVEGHGVEPDVVAADDPARVLAGEEPQLDAAIRVVLDELERRPRRPRRPAAPDRSGMGVDRRDQ